MMSMKLLQDILYKVRSRSLTGRTDLHISDVQIDSRFVGQGSCFIAIKGASQDGHAYIDIYILFGCFSYLFLQGAEVVGLLLS